MIHRASQFGREAHAAIVATAANADQEDERDDEANNDSDDEDALAVAAADPLITGNCAAQEEEEEEEEELAQTNNRDRSASVPFPKKSRPTDLEDFDAVTENFRDQTFDGEHFPTPLGSPEGENNDGGGKSGGFFDWNNDNDK